MVSPIPKSQENKAYIPQTQSWKLEKKYWLLAIAVACLLLFWFGSRLMEFKLARDLVELLPVVGTVAFAAEKVIKLVQ